jgi:hypothetical protein
VGGAEAAAATGESAISNSKGDPAFNMHNLPIACALLSKQKED